MPKSVGTDEHAFSAANKHIFARTYVCCSCGVDKATGAACGGRGLRNVTVEYGPSASPHPQEGYCGLFCRGTAADVNGQW